MVAQTVRSCLSRATRDLNAALEHPMADEDAVSYLEGVIEITTFFSEGSPSSQEDYALPEAGALRTIELRVADIAEESDDQAAASLESALEQLRAARTLLEEKLDEDRAPTERP